jgi:uncharacterized protein (DUF305 family)
MTRTHIRVIMAALPCAVVLAGCAAGPRAATQPTPQPAARSAAQPPAGAQGEQAAIERARADSARRPWTAADVHFMTAMIGHHAQAIEMSRMAPTHGARPEVRTLAERIINAQQDEIAIMQQWLRERRQPVPEPKPGGAPMAMSHHGMSHEMTMPGMLTAAQMQQLDAARGAEFDRLFLTFMIQHHRGATGMVRELFGTYGAAQDETVFKFASDVNVDQTTEIARMQRMLLALELGITPP